MVATQPVPLHTSAMGSFSRQDLLFLAGLLALNLAIRLSILNLNMAEYTDGILQLTVFKNPSGLYPPLYGALATAVAAAFSIPLESAGRWISAIAGTATVIPVYAMAHVVAGPRAAKAALLLYTVSPLPLRWSNRVMTDSLFLFLASSSMALVTSAIAQRGARRWNAAAGAAVSVAGLAALTRYQGVLLIAPLALMLVIMARRRARFPLSVLPAAVVWLAIPWWTSRQGFAHQDQLASRMGQSTLATLGAYWNTFESFVLISPYYFGYPIVALALCAALAWRSRPFAPGSFASFLLPWLAFGVPLLLLQSAFGSFQYRYMMPLLPAVLVAAGAGAVALQAALRRRHVATWISIALGTVILATMSTFSAAVLWYQREAFADQKQAGLFMARTDPQTHLFSNERYGDFLQLGSPKLTYWSGRQVQTIYDSSTTDGLRLIPPGSLMAIGTHYGGEPAAFEVVERLKAKYQVTPLLEVPFRSQLLPLMDDIMVNPLFNQNPGGWVMRYVPQQFSTQLFRVDTPTPPGPAVIP